MDKCLFWYKCLIFLFKYLFRANTRSDPVVADCQPVSFCKLCHRHGHSERSCGLSIGVDKRTEEDNMFFSFLVVICESCKMLTCECTWVAISRTYLYRLAIFPKLETFRVLINKGNWEDEVVSISKWCNLWFVSKGRSNIWLWVI